jgi:hypothetical protein
VAAKYEVDPMQDLFENYVGDLRKLRNAFHKELGEQARELSKAMGIYARANEAALSSFMEKVSARGAELETAAAARLDQFRGLRALNQTPTNADEERVAAAAERAVAVAAERAVAAHVESEGDRKAMSSRPMVLVKSNPAA